MGKGTYTARMIRITPSISLNEHELQFSYIRAPGPGGQNVNKVATAAQLRFDAAGCKAITPAILGRLRDIAGQRMTKDGTIVITAHQHRTQSANRDAAADRLVQLLKKAATPPRRRVATKPTKGSKERRLEGKRRSATKKQNRARVTKVD